MNSAQRDILRKVHDEARENYIMILSDECERVMRELFERYAPKRVLEIGTAIGYSSSVMALMSECIVDTVEKDAARVAEAEKLWKSLGIRDRINSYCGNSDDLLPDMVEGKIYDFVFLDGAKSSYKKQLVFLDGYIRQGGIALCDDVTYLGLVKGNEKPPHKHRTIVNNMREFLNYVQTEERYDCEILDEGNGIAIVRKK